MITIIWVDICNVNSSIRLTQRPELHLSYYFSFHEFELPILLFAGNLLHILVQCSFENDVRDNLHQNQLGCFIRTCIFSGCLEICIPCSSSWDSDTPNNGKTTAFEAQRVLMASVLDSQVRCSSKAWRPLSRHPYLPNKHGFLWILELWADYSAIRITGNQS